MKPSTMSLVNDNKEEHLVEFNNQLLNDKISIFSEYKIADFPRLIALRKSLLSAKKSICIERAKLFTEYYEIDGLQEDDSLVQRANALAYTLERLPVRIFERELIVGSTTRYRLGCPVYPEFFGHSIWPDLPGISDRKSDKTFISDEDISILSNEIFPFWKDYNVLEYTREKNNNPESIVLAERMVFYLLGKIPGISHIIIDYPTLINQGFAALIEKAKTLENACTDKSQKKFYRATQISMNAVVNFARRYAEKCEELASDLKTQHIRADELKKIARILRRVPAQKAETLHEALQAIWITQIALHQENANIAVAFGRMDQYLNPFYVEDIKNNIITTQEAAELIGAFLVKSADHAILMSETAQKLFGGVITQQVITLGGLKSDGSDGTNELTYLMLKMTEQMALAEPDISARYHTKSPPAYRHALVQSIYHTGANPSMFNDEAFIEALVKNGVAREDARDYGIVGCVEPSSCGKSMNYPGAVYINLASVLELALHDGFHLLSGLQIGPHTGKFDLFTSFESFLDAFKTQLDFLVCRGVAGNKFLAATYKKLYPSSLLSSLIQGNFQKGKDITNGGAKYNTSGVSIVALADVSDSLSVIRKLIFENKLIEPKNLLRALANDFKYFDKIYSLVINKVPKYGTDNRDADAMASNVVVMINQSFKKHKNPQGGFFLVGFWSNTVNVGMGLLTGALPNGRRSKMPFASGATEVSGVARRGPTAALNSIAKLPSHLMANGMVNNKKFSKKLLSQPSKLDILDKLIEVYFKKGGMQLQFTIQDASVLLDAQKNPENYRDLLVRISGYTAYFTELTKEVQNEIIGRTESGIGA